MSKRLTTMLTGAAALLTAACLSEARASAQTPRPDDNQVAQADRSRGFFGFADWDSRFGGYDRDRRAEEFARGPDRRPSAPSRDAAKGPPGGFGRFSAPPASSRDAWRPGSDAGRGGPPFATPGRGPAAAPPRSPFGGDWRRGVSRSSERGRGAPAWAGRGGAPGRGAPAFAGRFGHHGRGPALAGRGHGRGHAFGHWRGGSSQRRGPAVAGRGHGRGGPAFARRGWASQRHGGHRCGFSGRGGRGGAALSQWRGGFGQRRGSAWGGRGHGRGPAYAGRGHGRGPAFGGRFGQRPGAQRHGFSQRHGRGPALGQWRRGFAPNPRAQRGGSNFRGFGPGGRFGFGSGAPGRGGMGRFDWRDFRRPQSRPAAPAQPARPAAPAPRTPDRGRPAAPPAPAPRTAPPAAAPRGGDTDRRIDNLMREIEELRRLLRR